jgi:hypothetical protein
MVWFSGKVWVSGKRGLHDAYVLDIRKSAIFMLPVTWVSGKRGLHDACGLGIGQALSPCCLWFGYRTGARTQATRALAVVTQKFVEFFKSLLSWRSRGLHFVPVTKPYYIIEALAV